MLLAGHTGFKGSWLALWLHELGAVVTGFSTAPPTVPSLFELARVSELLDDRRGDVGDEGSVRAAVMAAQPEVVFHLDAADRAAFARESGGDLRRQRARPRGRRRTSGGPEPCRLVLDQMRRFERHARP